MSLFDDVVSSTLPVRLRTIFNLRWLAAWIAPVKQLYTAYLIYTEGSAYDLAHTSQLCRMEGVLNDTFDNVSRGIYIADGPTKDDQYIYEAAEGKTTYIYEDDVSEAGVTYIYEYTETVGLVDFVIMVPVAVSYDAARMNSIIKKYKLPGRGYSIQTF